MKRLITPIVIIVVLFVVAFIIYSIFVKDDQAEPTGTLVTEDGTSPTFTEEAVSGTPTNATGRELLILLEGLRNITLDDSVFFNPAFGVLRDISRPLPPITNEGRRNPFAPIGSDASIPTTSFDPGNFGL